MVRTAMLSEDPYAVLVSSCHVVQTHCIIELLCMQWWIQSNNYLKMMAYVSFLFGSCMHYLLLNCINTLFYCLLYHEFHAKHIKHTLQLQIGVHENNLAPNPSLCLLCPRYLQMLCVANPWRGNVIPLADFKTHIDVEGNSFERFKTLCDYRKLGHSWSLGAF